MLTDQDIFEGTCHCEAIGFAFHTLLPSESWMVRACQCSFCRAHGARTTSDPNGSVIFHISTALQPYRYQFGAKSADFLVCDTCGVYLAAVLTSAAGRFATLNVNTICTSIQIPDATAVSYEGESLEQKIARREKRWTPVVIPC